MSKRPIITDDAIKAALAQFNGHRRNAAEFLGMKERNMFRRIAKMADPPDPQVYPIVPAGHKLKGVSSLQRITDPNTGETVLQWVKTAEDREQAEALAIQVLEALKSQLPRAKAIPKPKAGVAADLATLYPITDYHMGMLAWGEETGAAWDMKIAEDLLMRWFDYMVQNSPASSHGILYQGGDFLHYDSLLSITPRSGHILDADSRPQKMVRISLRALRYVINLLLTKHETVHVIMAEGNHDPMASIFLREMFAMYYENEPRVTVEVRPDPYYAFAWGDVLLLFHHGHLRKTVNIADVFVRKFREEYGQSKMAYGHMGHLHHKLVLESSLMKIEQHPTLASADAFASRGGWMSDCEASAIVYHKRFGEVSRLTATPQMVREMTK